jgi:hypothetical protein
MSQTQTLQFYEQAANNKELFTRLMKGAQAQKLFSPEAFIKKIVADAKQSGFYFSEEEIRSWIQN